MTGVQELTPMKQEKKRHFMGQAEIDADQKNRK